MKHTLFAKTALVCALAAAGSAFASADNMVVAVQQLSTIIEPQGINNNALDRVVYSVFETPIRAYLKTGELHPGLAESWKLVSPESLEFKIRKGVVFHDGTPLRADDVVFSFGPERFMSKDAPGRAAAVEFLGDLKSVEKIDDYTVRVTMNGADPLIERRFAARMSEIISQDGWMKAGSWENWIKKPIGTGPYRIADFRVGSRLTLERFDGYWDAKAPAAKVNFVEVPELSSRVAGLRSGEGLYAVPDMGELLSIHGKRIRVYCSNSAGSTRLQNMHADRHPGHLVACIHKLADVLPVSERERILKTHPESIPLVFPDVDAEEAMTDLFIRDELAGGVKALADVSVLWLGEPDHSSHEPGLTSEATQRGRTHADKMFGRVLEWWKAEGRDKNVQLVTLSDHGHAEIAGHVDFAGILRAEGFCVVTDSEILRGAEPESADIVIAGEYAAGLWVRDKTPENLARIVRILTTATGVGLVFSQPNGRYRDAVSGRVPGTLSEALVFSDSVRGPDLRIVGRGDNASGRIVSGGPYALGSGNHGGLTPAEIHAHLALAGSAFTSTPRRHRAPAGHDDLAQTILSLVGVSNPTSGARELEEAMDDSFDESYGVFTLRLSQNPLNMSVEHAVFAGRRYVLSAEREDGLFPTTF